MPSVRGVLALTLACLQVGCTVPIRPDYLAQPNKSSFGRIAVVPARFDPDYHFEGLPPGKPHPSLDGAMAGLRVSTLCWIFIIFCAPVLVPLGALAGAASAPSAQETEKAKAAAQRAIAALKLQTEVVDAALRYSKAAGLEVGRLEPTAGPATPDGLASYTDMQGLADSVIEISILRTNAVATGEQELRLSLGMQARVRVLSTHDGKEIDTFAITCGSGPRTPDQWIAADGKAIKTAFDQCAASIAEQAIDEILLVYHPTEMRELPESSTQERVPPYALRAIEPPLRARFWDFHSRYRNWGNLELYILGSLQPEFRWEPWPRGFDIIPGDGPGQAHQVRYDLRIIGAEGVAYERLGLVEAWHRLEQPLTPCRIYRWTVRARFILDDAPKATEWTGAYNIVDGTVVAPWWYRRDSVPPLFPPRTVEQLYPLIETPGAKGEACPGR